MALNQIIDLSTTAGGNLDFIGVGIPEGMFPDKVNDAMRALGKILADAVPRHVAKGAGTYTPAKTDHNQFWRCTGAVTLNLTAAATLTDGWALWVRANGGAVTIDPNGAELIDGAATLVIPDGSQALIICTGSAFFTIFNNVVGSFSTLTYTGLLTSPYSFKQDGRLTLTTAVPVTVSDVTAAGTIYYTPYLGNVISLYSGTNWVNRVFSEISLALTATSGKPYDVFVYDNAGVAALETLVWTNDTTRATALVRQDGVLCKTGALTRRYVGTFYASASNQTEDSRAKRFVWNMYNRVRRDMIVTEPANSWSYTTATWRQANANTANQLDYVCGLTEDCVEAQVMVIINNLTANGNYVGIGVDVTNAIPAAGAGFVNAVGAGGATTAPMCFYRAMPPSVGRHFLAWLEYATAGGTTTWFGDNNTPTISQSGIIGTVIA